MHCATHRVRRKVDHFITNVYRRRSEENQRQEQAAAQAARQGPTGRATHFPETEEIYSVHKTRWTSPNKVSHILKLVGVVSVEPSNEPLTKHTASQFLLEGGYGMGGGGDSQTRELLGTSTVTPHIRETSSWVPASHMGTESSSSYPSCNPAPCYLAQASRKGKTRCLTNCPTHG